MLTCVVFDSPNINTPWELQLVFTRDVVLMFPVTNRVYGNLKGNEPTIVRFYASGITNPKPNQLQLHLAMLPQYYDRKTLVECSQFNVLNRESTLDVATWTLVYFFVDESVIFNLVTLYDVLWCHRGVIGCENQYNVV